jgi:hypothetical protein
MYEPRTSPLTPLMWRTIFITVAVCLSLAAVIAIRRLSAWDQLTIADASRPYDLTLTDSRGIEIPSGLSIRITGRLEGRAILEVGSTEPMLISGEIDERRYCDFFDSHCLVKYRPEENATGHLVLSYRFH